jgi:outer membrane protein OmpA-like peptidoglycan-associated protein
VILSLATLTNACIASRKFVRNEVKTSADSLNARVDTTDANVKEVSDRLSRVDEKLTGVDENVKRVDAKTNEHTQRLDVLKTDVQTVDQKAGQAQTAAQRTAGELVILDTRFQNRNQFVITSEKTITFKFNSATIAKDQESVLEEIAGALKQNPDALIVLEGRTDSTGNDAYNVRLGERRAEAVKRYLAVDQEVPIYKIHQISFGKDRPVAENASRQGREKNRAVTMMILVPRNESSSASRQQ